MFTKYVTWGEMKKAAQEQNVPDDVVVFNLTDDKSDFPVTWGQCKQMAERQNMSDYTPILDFHFEDCQAEAGAITEFIFGTGSSVHRPPLTPKRLLTAEARKIMLRILNASLYSEADRSAQKIKDALSNLNEALSEGAKHGIEAVHIGYDFITEIGKQAPAAHLKIKLAKIL